MSKKFSKHYLTFGSWRDQASDTSYKKRIERLHALHPIATLSQLRGHAMGRRRTISTMTRSDPNRIDWGILRPREMRYREKSLDVLTLMRNRGYSLTKASRKVGISPETVRRHTGGVKKDGVRWVTKSYDVVSRQMNINENGRSKWITVRDSRYASIIGRYQNAVGRYRDTGDESLLEPFKNVRIKDSDGRWHSLETDPRTLHEIQERRPDEEIFTIYNTQGGD